MNCVVFALHTISSSTGYRKKPKMKRSRRVSFSPVCPHICQELLRMLSLIKELDFQRMGRIKKGPPPKKTMQDTVLVFQIVRLNIPLADVRLRIPLVTKDLWGAERHICYGSFQTQQSLLRSMTLFQRWKRHIATRPVRPRVKSWMRTRRTEETELLLF